MTGQPIVPPWAESAAREYWDSVGGWPHPSPDLARTVAMTLPLDVITLSSLTVARVERWLVQRGVLFPFSCADRPLHGLLLVQGGAGLVFLDGRDDERERRFSLAHEIAHFLRHYRAPRNRVLNVFGPELLEVLDGVRKPTAEERISGALIGVPFGPDLHLIEREVAGEIDRKSTWDAEDEADALAVELLAPAGEVLGRIATLPITGRAYLERQIDAVGLLREEFGLPDRIAGAYARHLMARTGQGPSVFEEWGLR